MADLNILGISEEEITQTLAYMRRPMSKFYLRKNIRLEQSHDGDMEYDHSPYSAVFMTTPDCTTIIVPGENAESKTYDDTKIAEKLNVDIPLSKNDNDTLLDHYKTKDNDLYSIPFGIRKQLVLGFSNPFIPMVSNFYDDSTFDVPDVSLDTVDVGENRFGVRQTLPRYTLQSQVGQTFQLSFTDVSFFDKAGSQLYGKLVLTHLHKAWVSYMHSVRIGNIFPGDKYSFNLSNYGDFLTASKTVNIRDDNGKIKVNADTYQAEIESNAGARSMAMARMKRVINYVSSVYYFKLAPDGKTITYWSRYAGVFPKNYGNSALSGSNRELTKISIDYQSQFFEDLKLNLLEAFNITSLGIADKIDYSKYPDGFIPVDPDLGTNPNQQSLIGSLLFTNRPFVYVSNGSFKLHVGT